MVQNIWWVSGNASLKVRQSRLICGFTVKNGPVAGETPMEYSELPKQRLGARFWGRGYLSITSGNVTDDVILQYMELQPNRELLQLPDT